MHYFIGDLQGCDDAFERLLAEIGFSPSRDALTMLGDLVNRGPQSLAALRRLQGLGHAADVVLGNHDLHLLAVSIGARKPQPMDTMQAVLDAPDRDLLLAWLRSRPLALMREGWLCVHAGVAPDWDAEQALALAGEVSSTLQSPGGDDFLRSMYGNEPSRWSNGLDGHARLRYAVNVLTRIRYCNHDGTLNFKVKESVDAAPPGMTPWFDVEGRKSAATPIAFGHWSTLGLVNRPQLLALDTGCVWGGALTAARVDGGRRDIVQVKCAPRRLAV